MRNQLMGPRLTWRLSWRQLSRIVKASTCSSTMTRCHLLHPSACSAAANMSSSIHSMPCYTSGCSKQQQQAAYLWRAASKMSAPFSLLSLSLQSSLNHPSSLNNASSAKLEHHNALPAVLPRVFHSMPGNCCRCRPRRATASRASGRVLCSGDSSLPVAAAAQLFTAAAAVPRGDARAAGGSSRDSRRLPGTVLRLAKRGPLGSFIRRRQGDIVAGSVLYRGERRYGSTAVSSGGRGDQRGSNEVPEVVVLVREEEEEEAKEEEEEVHGGEVDGMLGTRGVAMTSNDEELRVEWEQQRQGASSTAVGRKRRKGGAEGSEASSEAMGGLPGEGKVAVMHADVDFLSLSDTELLKQCEMTTFRASGPGGQHRNKTESAVRLRHVGTGCVAQAVEERSQHMNRTMAVKRLRQSLALKVRTPLSLSSYRPSASLAAILPPSAPLRRQLNIKLAIGPKHPSFYLGVKELLDVLSAADGSLSDAATAIGVSTGGLSKVLTCDKALIQEANNIRQSFGLKPLR